jgi:hypothetical protein
MQAQLSHPYVAHILNYLEEAGNIFMVMEYVKGDTLEKRLATRGSLPQHEAVSICQDVLTALGFMHAQGILHRDIKPGNIMVTDTGVVKVTDFGIAKVAGAKGQTQTGMRIGTLWYMAPEQLQGREASVASDLYALGVTLYEMATGRLPFQGDSEYTVMKGHIEDAPEPPWLINQRVSQALGHVILKALAKQPEQRYHSAQDFATALAPLSQPSPVSAEITPTPAPHQSTRSNTGRGKPWQQLTKVRWLWSALALLVSLGGLLVWQHTLKNQPDSRPRQPSMHALSVAPPQAPEEPSHREEQDANDRGAPKDEAEAVQWYHTAADQGYVATQDGLRLMEPPKAECPPDELFTLVKVVPLYLQWHKARHAQWEEDEIKDPILEAIAKEEEGQEGTARGRGAVFERMLPILEAADAAKARRVRSGVQASVVMQDLRAGKDERNATVTRLVEAFQPSFNCLSQHRQAIAYLTMLNQMPHFPEPMVNPEGAIGGFLGAYMRKHALVDHAQITQTIVTNILALYTAMQPSAQHSLTRAASVALLEKALEKLAPKVAVEVRQGRGEQAYQALLHDEPDLAKRQTAAIQEYEDAYKTLASEYQEALRALAPTPPSRLQEPQTTLPTPPPDLPEGAPNPPQPPSAPQNARRAGETSPEPEPGTNRRPSRLIIPKPPRSPQPWKLEK